MDELQLLEHSTLFLAGSAAVLGLVIGSFLNVVIHRVPIMLQRRWSRECAELAGQEPDQLPETFNLVVPGSTCPHCGHRIRAIENIPLLSYVFLRGRCAECGTPISPRYPLVELVCALLSMLTVLHFGYSPQSAAALFFTWCLVPLFLIDFDHQLLPDSMTLPLLWAGLLLSLYGVFTDSASSIIGAAAGYLSLWSIYHLFRLVTGKEGMGYGDFKLLGAIGAWTGWQLLPVVILFSSVVGAVIGASLILFRGRNREMPIPFGPFLAAAGWLTLLWGHDIIALYLR